jgi:hypothetical protein
MRTALRNSSVGIGAMLPFLLLTSVAEAHNGANPAGGAPIGDVILATGGAIVLTALLFAVGLAHRRGRIRFLERAGLWSERQWGLPAWSALPGAISLAALLVALVGMYWDISLHIDQGRDPGPIANPAHYLILAGLFGVFVAGFVSMVLPRERPGRSAVAITSSWQVPLGGLLLFTCAAFSLLGFPLDDAWHRLFGQDVTLWGPTHLMLFGGAALTLIGRSVLLVEGARVARTRKGAPARKSPLLAMSIQRASLAGGFLIGLSTFQGEFDFGVPQFQFVFQPALIMLAGSMALVAARLWAGRGGALMAAGLFIAVRGFVSLMVGPVLGETVPHFPLYLAEAGLVELAALATARQRPLVFALLSGTLIGTIGLAAEWGWSHVWMPLPWPGALFPEAAIAGLVAALAGALIGGLIGAALASDRVSRPRFAGLALATASVAVAGLAGFGLHTSITTGQTARVTLTDVRSGPHRTVSARVELDPTAAGGNARWLNVTAWQGGGFVLDRLVRTKDGVYHTTKPIPVYGNWKALLRLHGGSSLGALPIYLPRDDAIPAPGVPAPRKSFTRKFVSDRQILQREAKNAAPWLSSVAYSLVLVLALALFAALAWGLRRLALDGEASWRKPPTLRSAGRRRAVFPGSRDARAST